MSQTDPRPNFSDDADTVFESLMEEVMPLITGLEEEFQSLDLKQAAEQLSAKKEGVVIDFLQGEIPDVTTLKQMLESLKLIGVTHPTCNKVMTIIKEMTGHDDYSQQPGEFFTEMSRMSKFAIIIEQIARSEARVVEMPKGVILNEIALEELFMPKERQALVIATETFLASE